MTFDGEIEWLWRGDTTVGVILLNKGIRSSDIIECIYSSCDNLLIDANVFDVYSGKELDQDFYKVFELPMLVIEGLNNRDQL